MEFVEATAYYLQAGIENTEDKIVIQCMIDPDRRFIVRGDWMGYLQRGTMVWPFILKRNGNLLRGGQSYSYFASTVASTLIASGEEFQVKPSKENREGDTHTYRIAEIKFFKRPYQREVNQALLGDNALSWMK